MSNHSASFSTTSTGVSSLIAANSNLLYHEPETLIAGQNLVRGAVLGKITASGKYTLSLAAAVDGSQVPAAILVDDTDASAADKGVLVYTRGDFIASGLTLGAGHTAASVHAATKDLGIFIHFDQTGA